MKKLFVLQILVLLILSGCASFKWTENPTEPKKPVEKEDVYVQDAVLKPERLESYNQNKGCISISTETAGSEVYLNSNYQGQTPIEIKNLMPGIYILQFKTYSDNEKVNIHKYMIEVESDRKQFYYLNNSKLSGK